MSEITFTQSSEELRGKRASVVARMIEMLAEAGGDPVTWDELTEDVEHYAQYTPAMHALEMVGAVERWEYVEPGATKSKVAYCIAEEVKVQS